jgi:competence protein ComEA
MALADPAIAAARTRRLGVVLVAVTALVFVRASLDWESPLSSVGGGVIVEVRGDVPAPGFYALAPPVTVSVALAAAGSACAACTDDVLPSGTTIVVSPQGVQIVPMDAVLAFGLPIDVNHASVEALATIPGLGPSKAVAIVSDRASAGPFGSVEDLDRVKGIGPATVAALRPFVTVLP